MEKKILTDDEYKERMLALGYTYDEVLGKFFWYDWAFLSNVDDNTKEVSDLITFDNNGHPTYMASVINDLMCNGGKLLVCHGAIDDYGERRKRALYCFNYRELYSEKRRVRKNRRIGV